MRGIGKPGRMVEKRKREKNGADDFRGMVSRVGVVGVSGDGSQKISYKVSGNFPESWVCSQ